MKYSSRQKQLPIYLLTSIEILGATLEEACLKKMGEFLFADLHPIL
jgi:hypothetical protein